MKDLEDKTRNGKVEMGKSPFNLADFIRMDGRTARMVGRAKNIRLPEVKVASSYETTTVVNNKIRFDI